MCLSPVTELFLIRHCKATGQHPDADLTSEGQEQAQALAEFLAEFGSGDNIRLLGSAARERRAVLRNMTTDKMPLN